MGTNCLVHAALLVNLSAIAAPAQSQILPPGAPLSMPPADPPEDQLERDMERRRELFRPDQERDDPIPGQPVQTPLEKRQHEQLIKESQTNKSLRLMMAATLAYPRIKTSGKDRRDYTAEPTMLFHAAIRLTDQAKDNKLDWITGLRLAPFAGRAVYKEHAGTYGFVYFGPMIGVGKISLVRPAGKGKEQAERIGPYDPDDAETYSRTGWLAAGGLAMQSRFANYDRGSPAPGEDLSSKSVAFDAPGLWGEFTYTVTYYNAVSINTTGGLQLGKKKTFLYVGLGMGLWY